jgi:hypothetical protein
MRYRSPENNKTNYMNNIVYILKLASFFHIALSSKKEVSLPHLVHTEPILSPTTYLDMKKTAALTFVTVCSITANLIGNTGSNLILGWCILLRLYYNENDHSYLCSQLIVSLLYVDHTTCFGYTAIFRRVTYKMLKIVRCVT